MIYQRVEILKQGNVIDEEIHEYILSAIAFLEKAAFDVQSDKMQTFITHLAMATMRQKNGEMAAKMEQFILSDLQAHAQFNKAFEVSNKIIEQAPIVFVDEEKDYVYLHMCNILGEIKE